MRGGALFMSREMKEVLLQPHNSTWDLIRAYDLSQITNTHVCKEIHISVCQQMNNK